MIKIKLSEYQKKEIESLHWKWFECKYKNKYTGIKNDLGLNSDDEIKEIVLGERQVLEGYKSRIGKKKSSIINYDVFSKGSAEWGAYQLCEKLGIDVCPYCDRQYIFTVTGGKSRITRPEIDHFYPKSKYPYLSCSLYNFIPSCHICNHIKRDCNKDIIYPYEEEFGNDGKFRICFSKNIDFDDKSLLDSENIEADIKCSGTSRVKIKNSVQVFHIKELYNEHKLDLTDLLQRYRNYSNPKINDIVKMLIFSDSSIKSTIPLNERNRTIEKCIKFYMKNIKRMILGLPLGAGDKQYPLKKYKEDIIEQLDSE